MVVTKTYETVKIEREGGITWVILNRPEKKNAMTPQMHMEMLDVLDELEFDPETKVLVLTGAGNSFCAGQDLKEFIIDQLKNGRERARYGWAASEWRWRRLYYFPKPTIAMVNGFCFGGGFTQLIACDFALSADEATYGLSEVNWGSFPGGLVSRVLAEALTYRDAMNLIMTGDNFNGKQASAMRLVTASYPLAQLRDETIKLAQKLMTKNPHTLRACKEVYKHVKNMDYADAEDYMWAKMDALNALDPGSRDKGIKDFAIDKKYKPGFDSYAVKDKA